MSNVERLIVSLAAIPEDLVVTDAVPDAEKFVFGPSRPSAVAANRFIEFPNTSLQERPRALWVTRVSDAGSHTNFTASVEASIDGISWFGLHAGILSPAPSAVFMATLIVSEIGVRGPADQFASGADLSGGLALPLRATWPFYRVGLAGDNAAADGAAEFGLLMSRDN